MNKILESYNRFYHNSPFALHSWEQPSKIQFLHVYVQNNKKKSNTILENAKKYANIHR